jgi:hypothetical protein
MVDFGIELFTSNDAESWQCTATPINEEGYPEAGCAGYTFGTGRPEWGIESGDFNVLQTVNLDGMNPSHVLCEVDGAGGNLENTNKTTRSRSTFAAPSTGSCDSNTWRWLPFNVKEFNGDLAAAIESLRNDCDCSMGTGDMIQVDLHIPNREPMATGCRITYTFVLFLPSEIRNEKGQCASVACE